MNTQELVGLVDRLRALPTETEWLEFKIKQSVHAVIQGKKWLLNHGARALLACSSCRLPSKGFSKAGVARLARDWNRSPAP